MLESDPGLLHVQYFIHEVCMDACMEHGIPCFSEAWQIIPPCSTVAMVFYILSSSHDLHGPDSRCTQLAGIKGLEHFLQYTTSTVVATEFDSRSLLPKKSVYNLLITSYWYKCQIIHLLLKDSYFSINSLFHFHVPCQNVHPRMRIRIYARPIIDGLNLCALPCDACPCSTTKIGN